MRTPLFYHFRPLILASKIDKQIMLFSSRFLDLLFSFFPNIFQNMVDLGTPFEIRWGQKWYQNQPSGATDHKKSRRVSSKTKLVGRPCSSKPARSTQYIIFPDFGQISAPCSPILDPALMISSLFLIRSLQLTERQAIATSNQELPKNFLKTEQRNSLQPIGHGAPKMIFSQ